jgi:hypothetical protein
MGDDLCSDAVDFDTSRYLFALVVNKTAVNAAKTPAVTAYMNSVEIVVFMNIVASVITLLLYCPK